MNSSSESAMDYRLEMNLTARQTLDAERHFKEWDRGPFSHLKKLSIPDSALHREFRFDASGHLMFDLLSARVYCDSMTGVSGSDLDQDPIVADLVVSGWIEFVNGKERNLIKPGQICIRNTRASWEFACAPATVAQVITIPRHLVMPRVASRRVFDRAFVADASDPEVKFFLNFLRVIEESAGELRNSISAQNMARDACASLMSSIVSQRPGGGIADNSSATVAAAKKVIMDNLTSCELSPQMVARAVGVSLRTLHRAFSLTGDSVMSFTRRMRLQEAHEELGRADRSASVSEISARWHFADASHFIRHFKAAYGETPAAFLRRQKR
ncbi:helix-turn-helix transcriptional regulator [Streptomyces sp. AS58]|uniref:helix-turn-helix transcriptional regulator n=1 Tax=Streptomyces sp. AS58 TaxID=1519489 RepID=UPI000A673267|nr:helix-turn-helix transcriptional regulator [Streptomyces sp. AS58]